MGGETIDDNEICIIFESRPLHAWLGNLQGML